MVYGTTVVCFCMWVYVCECAWVCEFVSAGVYKYVCVHKHKCVKVCEFMCEHQWVVYVNVCKLGCASEYIDVSVCMHMSPGTVTVGLMS